MLPPFVLSASRLGTYHYCPGSYRSRYVLKLKEPESVDMHFGLAVHKGLESHYRDEDAELAFRRDWRERQALLTEAGIPIPSGLSARGLDLLEQAIELGFDGTPERKFLLNFPQPHDIGVTGYIDLEGFDYVLDWKTTNGKWNQERADKEIFQPCLYSWAYFKRTGVWPRFFYVILSRQPGVAAQIFEATRTEAEVYEGMAVMADIYQQIRNEVFPCKCRDRRHDVQAAA